MEMQIFSIRQTHEMNFLVLCGHWVIMHNLENRQVTIQYFDGPR